MDLALRSHSHPSTGGAAPMLRVYSERAGLRDLPDRDVHIAQYHETQSADAQEVHQGTHRGAEALVLWEIGLG